MRWILTVLLSLLAQTATPPANLPPAYPRAGATKILDNDRVQVWNIAWLKGQPSPLHRHLYDLVGVYYEPGDRMIISPQGEKRPVSTKAWDLAFQRKDVTHIEEGVSDKPLRAVFVEMKRPGPYGADKAPGGAPAFTGEGATQKLDNERVTVWEYTRAPAGPPHRHLHDAVVVAIDGQRPRAAWVAQGTTHVDEGAGAASRVYVFEIK
jgi:predicted metal-dependent enzyme (double-stranded beta helix superfamily)